MSDIWDKLSAHRAATASIPMTALFQDGGDRFANYSVEADGMLLDYSKTALDATARTLLLDLAQAVGLKAKIDALMSGEKINSTEGRAVLHTALRAPADAVI